MSQFYILVPKELRHKLDFRLLLCNLIGFFDTKKIHYYWDPISKKTNVSRDVTSVSHLYEPKLSHADNPVVVDVLSSVELYINSTPVAEKLNLF